MLGAQPQVASASLCPAPALARLRTHTVTAGETLDTIARQYRLLPATIMGFNPSVRTGRVTPGNNLKIPPFNGIQVSVPPGTSIKTLAAQYNVRADVLFEVNGCRPSLSTAFIPGVNWSPNQPTSDPGQPTTAAIAIAYPLPQRANILMGYGWKRRITDPAQRQSLNLHSGVDLAATTGTQVRAAATGIVAFVGDKGDYGRLIVINHAQGYQTRYAQLQAIQVKRGQRVQIGQPIGTVGQTGQPSSAEAHLHFELRSNSKLGWVAEDPTSFLKD